MSDATTQSILAGLEALLAVAGVAFPVLAPEAAALIAGIKTVVAHGNGTIDASTMMASVTSLDATIAADNKAADSALDAKFKGG